MSWRDALPSVRGKLLRDEPLSPFTWFRVGGAADVLFIPADADDLYQETMMKAFRAYGRLDADANVRAWIYRIATNTFLSDRRKHGRVDLLDDVAAQAIPAAQTDHAAGLDARALLEEVAVFVDGLPPKQRVALTLRKYHELGYAEIADALRCSEAAARASVHEALRKLRDCFGDRL